MPESMNVIYVFMAVLVGVVLVGVLAGEVYKITQYDSGVTNETVTINSSEEGILAENDVLTFGECYNGTTGDDIIIIGQCNFTYAGFIKCNETIGLGGDGGPFYCSYTFARDDYVADGTTRTITGLVVLFFVIAIVAGAAGFAYMKLKDMGMF